MKWSRVVLVAAVGACASRDSATGPTVDIVALAGGAGDPGAIVIAHRANGQVLDEQMADAVGRARVHVEDGGWISVVFPRKAQTSVVTTLAPKAGGELDIYGPDPDPGPPVVAGTLLVMPGQDAGADDYELDLGCLTLHVPSFTQPIDLNALCFGSDTNLDLLIRASRAGAPVGYAAGRLPLADGVVQFQPAQWDTTTGSVPITLDGVAPTLDWVLHSDGLPFAAQPIAGSAPIWTGLEVDGATVHAVIASGATAQATTREIAGPPLSIALSAADFLPPIAPALALDPGAGLSLHWAAASPGADVVDLRLTWQVAGHSVVWDSVLPPDATSAILPAGDGGAADALGPPDAMPTALLRYIDGPAANGFADVAAAGLHVEDPVQPATILPRPADGELRETDTTGYVP